MSAAHGGLKDDLRSTPGTTTRRSGLVLNPVCHHSLVDQMLLYELLKQRDETTNISHKGLPDFEAHRAFVESKPYADWCFIEIDHWKNGDCFDLVVGACYLSKQDEIGIHIFKAHQGKGYGLRAVKALIEKHGPKRYLANINPRNERSAKMFGGLGFMLIQQTYELDP
jgi:RimJ/RimL family protein N-acetyltransferase